VILLVDLDPGSGAAIIKKAHNQGVKVIDYDRLTLGGGADYYVSFDNTKVGKLQGQGLVNCLKSSGAKTPTVAELNGSPTDNNATLFANGYNSVLDPKYASGDFKKGPNQSVPDWDNQKALTIFEQMLQQTNNKIDGVLSANDGLANSVISAINARKLKSIPVTGQDATAQGIQHILAGEQCMTVYKAVKAEADAASKLAIALAKGQTPTTNGSVDNKGTKTPSVLLTPVAVTKSNIKDTVIKDGFLKRGDICVGKYASLCTKAGI
jgi:D-xylose transport system substrate-binding protein